jgi:hypothetical protein
MAEQIKTRDRDAIIQSLRAGVVPRLGLHHIQVGRAKEIETLIKDIERIADGGSTIRFVIGEYGAGKTFFLNLIRMAALQKGLITLHADLSPERRLYATGGQARGLYTELLRNLSTRTKPDGGGLSSVVERFITSALKESRETGAHVESAIFARLDQLTELVGGYDFATVVAGYWKGHNQGDEQLKINAIRWLRGEFSTKTDARNALGVRTIIDDLNVYDHLKLLARFIKLAGYNGMLICLDEMVNLYKLANSQARKSNYEQILRILNDSLQGIASQIGFVLGGTPEFLMDTRRGLYSYEALQSRLAENVFSGAAGLQDFSGPVIRLANLSQEELYILLRNIRHVFASGDTNNHLVPDEALKQFMIYCSKKIGEAYFRTPRNTIRAFVDMLSLLEQNPGMDWQMLLQNIDVAREENPDRLIEETEESPDKVSSQGNDDDLTTFRL